MDKKHRFVMVLFIVYIVILTVSAIGYIVYRDSINEDWYRAHGIESPDFVKPYPVTLYGFAAELSGFVIAFTSLIVLKKRIAVGVITLAIILIAGVTIALGTVTPTLNSTMLGRLGGKTTRVALYVDEEATPDLSNIYHYIFDAWVRLSPPMAVSTQMCWNNTFDDLLVDVYNGTWVSNATVPPPEYGGALAPYLLQCGIETAGGVLDTVSNPAFPTWKWMNTTKYAFLIFVCGGTMDMEGLSVRDWHAMIVRESVATAASPSSMEHELGHMFGAAHCDAYCIMNPLAISIGVGKFCDNCRDTIASNL